MVWWEYKYKKNIKLIYNKNIIYILFNIKTIKNRKLKNIKTQNKKYNLNNYIYKNTNKKMEKNLNKNTKCISSKKKCFKCMHKSVLLLTVALVSTNCESETELTEWRLKTDYC